MLYPHSIFNDVLGPVMRGPSSSHTAAAHRLGLLARDLLQGRSGSVTVRYAQNGSLAHTHKTHGSDMGFAAGLCGIPLEDADAVTALAKRGEHKLRFEVVDEPADHPSNYHVTIKTACETLTFQAISTGGGAITVWEMMGMPCHLEGDTHVHLWLGAPQAMQMVEEQMSIETRWLTCEKTTCLACTMLCYQSRADLSSTYMPHHHMGPVLPIGRGTEPLPFQTYEELLALVDAYPDTPLSHWVLRYEMARGGLLEEEVYAHLRRIMRVMQASTKPVMEEVEGRILPSQAIRMKPQAALPGTLIHRTVMHITAAMEAKSALRPIVAAPTAGACGCLPGTLEAIRRTKRCTSIQMEEAVLTAGLIGLIFCGRATFAAEVAGCQVECGAASGMTAAAVAQLIGATPAQCLVSATLALQAVTGLACDPVGGRVEVPCLGKNVMAGMNALAAATMAMADFRPVVPLDQTIDAMLTIGKQMPAALRCTYGGLGATPASDALMQVADA